VFGRINGWLTPLLSLALGIASKFPIDIKIIIIIKPVTTAFKEVGTAGGLFHCFAGIRGGGWLSLPDVEALVLVAGASFGLLIFVRVSSINFQLQ
jgi:hypothetical protein